MDNTTQPSFEVNITTKHQQFIVSRGLYLTISISRFIAHGLVGVWIAQILYNECLHCKDCNVVVTVFLSLISLGCFANIGLPIEKFSHVKIN